jgi:hypothetical protein
VLGPLIGHGQYCNDPDLGVLGPVPHGQRPYGQTAERYLAVLKMEGWVIVVKE